MSFGGDSLFFYESHRFGGNDEFNLFYFENFNFSIHLHRCFEFVYIEEGELTVGIDNEIITLSDGEMMLIFPNQLHSYCSTTYSKGFVCIFSPEYVNMFYQYIKNKKQENIVTKLDKETNDFILKNLPDCQNNKLLIKACLYAICSDIFKKTNLADNKMSGDNILQHKILTRIENSFANEISLRAIAKELGYDYQYISRYFNAQFKVPFSKMLNERRINYAAYLIKNSDKSFTEISFNCGYKSIRTFNRNFYEIMKKTPSEYRKSL